MTNILAILTEYWYVFLIITIFLLLALAGYYLDEKYRFIKEITIKDEQKVKDITNSPKKTLTSMMNSQMNNPDFEVPEEKDIEKL